MLRSNNPIDQGIGARIAKRRAQIGLSQIKVAEALGIAFQQVQKYEKGINRISASRLFAITRVLGVPPAYFFDSNADEGCHGSLLRSDDADRLIKLLGQSSFRRLNGAFSRIEDASLRKAIIALIEAIANNEDSVQGKNQVLQSLSDC